MSLAPEDVHPRKFVMAFTLGYFLIAAYLAPISGEEFVRGENHVSPFYFFFHLTTYALPYIGCLIVTGQYGTYHFFGFYLGLLIQSVVFGFFANWLVRKWLI